MWFSCDACYDRGIRYTAFLANMWFSCDACYDRGIRYTAFWLKCGLAVTRATIEVSAILLFG